MAAQRKFQFETEYINGVFEAGQYSLTVSSGASANMHEIGVYIPDVTHIFLTGRVVFIDMLGRRGLWGVRGETVDGLELELTVALISEECDVELLEILEVKEKR